MSDGQGTWKFRDRDGGTTSPNRITRKSGTLDPAAIEMVSALLHNPAFWRARNAKSGLGLGGQLTLQVSVPCRSKRFEMPLGLSLDQAVAEPYVHIIQVRALLRRLVESAPVLDQRQLPFLTPWNAP